MASENSDVVFLGFSLPVHTWAYIGISALSLLLAFLNFLHTKSAKKDTERVEREGKIRQATQSTFDRDIATPIISRLTEFEAIIDTIVCTELVPSVDDAIADLKKCNKSFNDTTSIVETTIYRVKNNHSIFNDETITEMVNASSDMTDLVNEMLAATNMKAFAKALNAFKNKSEQFSGTVRGELKRYEEEVIYK